jgi:hypothetical protein
MAKFKIDIKTDDECKMNNFTKSEKVYDKLKETKQPEMEVFISDLLKIDKDPQRPIKSKTERMQPECTEYKCDCETEIVRPGWTKYKKYSEKETAQSECIERKYECEKETMQSECVEHKCECEKDPAQPVCTEYKCECEKETAQPGCTGREEDGYANADTIDNILSEIGFDDIDEHYLIIDDDCDYDMVDHPEHYNKYPLETIDIIENIWGTEKTAIWCEITAFKYRMRMGTKPGSSIEEDLKKEAWYLNKARELFLKSIAKK